MPEFAPYSENSTDPSRCPLCGQGNQCGVEEPSGCWCFSSQIEAATLQRIPEPARERACLCRRCAAGHQSANPAN